MKVVTKQPGQDAQIEEWDNPDFRDIQKFIGDLFCIAVRFPLNRSGKRQIIAYCDDNGLLKDLPLNFIRWDGSPIVGPVVFMAEDNFGEATESLTQDEIDFVLNLFNG